MIAIIDYDAGNVKNVCKAFAYLGEEAVLTRDPSVILSADGVVLPGVGAFGDAMEKLEAFGLAEVPGEAVAMGKPFLGVCLGLQLLFESSQESPGVKGLGILPGKCVRFSDAPGLKVPEMGWNSLHFPKTSRLFGGIPEDSYVYFVHSYYVLPEDPSVTSASAEYGLRFTAAIEKDNLFACQFHPEKSSAVGLAMLRNFLSVVHEEAEKC